MKSLSFLSQECQPGTHLGKCLSFVALALFLMKGKTQLEEKWVWPTPIFPHLKAFWNRIIFVSENSASTSEVGKLKRGVKWHKSSPRVTSSNQKYEYGVLSSIPKVPKCYSLKIMWKYKGEKDLRAKEFLSKCNFNYASKHKSRRGWKNLDVICTWTDSRTINVITMYCDTCWWK